RGRVDLAAFTALYASVAEAAGLRQLTATLGPPESASDADRVAFTVGTSWDTERVGRFTQSLALTLVHAGDHWVVEWSPALVLRDLDDRQRVAFVPERGPRGSILDRGGRALAVAGMTDRYPEAPLGAHVMGYLDAPSEREEDPVVGA